MVGFFDVCEYLLGVSNPDINGKLWPQAAKVVGIASDIVSELGLGRGVALSALSALQVLSHLSPRLGGQMSYA